MFNSYFSTFTGIAMTVEEAIDINLLDDSYKEHIKNLPSDKCCLTFNDGSETRIICLSIDTQSECGIYTNNWKNLINGMVKRSQLFDD